MKPCCAGAITAAMGDESTQVTSAQLEEALSLLAALIAIFERDGGYRRPKQQATLRAARALLVERGR